MAKYEIFGGKFRDDLSFGGVHEFENGDDALEAAYAHACRVYDKDPFRTLLEIQEEEEASEEQAREIYEAERDEALDYYVLNLDEEVDEDIDDWEEDVDDWSDDDGDDE
jgi:hypothetical protein